MSTASPGASSPANRRIHVHHIQASKAFGPGGGAYPARLVGFEDSTALVERVSDRSVGTLVAARPDAFAATLERDDLTLLDGAPLLLVNPGYGVLGIATGPATPPARLSVILVTRLEGGHSIEIPASDAEQPSWQLFAVTRR
jgi:hypothetical protein